MPLCPYERMYPRMLSSVFTACLCMVDSHVRFLAILTFSVHANTYFPINLLFPNLYFFIVIGACLINLLVYFHFT